MKSESGPGRAASTDYEGERTTLLAPLWPRFGSDEHLLWIARRMSKNLQFRADVVRWTALSLATRRQVQEVRQ